MTFRTDAVTQDWPRLVRYLESHGHRFALDPPPRQFASGFANYNYLVEVDGEPCVLRRPPPGPLPPGAYDMVREHRVLSRLWREFPLAPRAFHLCDDVSVLGAPFFLMEYRPGVSIGPELPLASSASRPRRRALPRTLWTRLPACIVSIPPPSTSTPSAARMDSSPGSSPVGPGAPTAPTTSNPAASCGKSSSGSKITPCPSARLSLVHNDFKLDNVLLDPERFTPVAVVDWDMCTRGCPLYDLAILLSYWTEPDDHPAMHILRQMPSAAPGFPRRAEVLEAYARRSGIDIGDFRFYRALSVFRLAIVFRQLFNLYRLGTRTGPEFAGFNDVADGLLDFALAIADGRRD